MFNTECALTKNDKDIIPENKVYSKSSGFQKIVKIICWNIRGFGDKIFDDDIQN